MMADGISLKEIEPKAASAVPSAAQIARGLPVPPVRLLQIMSPDEWEQFTEEYLSHFKSLGEYQAIRRLSGSGDLGLDVVAFTDATAGFGVPWDSYQCKRYAHALTPSDLYVEVGKIIYHSFKKTPPFNQTCRTPRIHVFVAPHGSGISVTRLLKDPDRFKQTVKEKWETHCVPGIAKGLVAPLSGELLSYFEAFDFRIFQDRSGVELIEVHEKTPFYAPRFGGGLPARGEASAPPHIPTASESVYLRKLFDAYAESLGKPINAGADLESEDSLNKHYNRQRVLFYNAESLRNFARDRTPPLTFESLQDDIFFGVVEIYERTYATGLERLRETISRAGSVSVAGNALSGVTRVPDQQGICHQLANDDRLVWVKKS